MPHKFTNVEYADILFVYGFCNGNGREAVREYERRFPNRRTPHYQTFARVFDYSRQHGRFPTATTNDYGERQHLNVEDDILDPRVKSWKLMDSPFPTAAIIAVYLSLVLVFLPAYMKNRKPYNLTTLIRYYNVFQIISCITLIYMIATSGYTQGELSLGCEPIDYSNKPTAIKMLTSFYWLYILKMIELVETIFFILRKKFNQVTGLHVYHHASTFALSYIGCKFLGGGMASIPVMLNSFIHILMYTYYYLSSLGPQWQKTLAPWKPKLTMAQMVQFTLLILHSFQALPTSCNVPKQFLLIYLPNVIVIFKMFYNFYTASYTSKDKETNNQKLKAT